VKGAPLESPPSENGVTLRISPEEMTLRRGGGNPRRGNAYLRRPLYFCKGFYEILCLWPILRYILLLSQPK